jgi:hypothetical protein
MRKAVWIAWGIRAESYKAGTYPTNEILALDHRRPLARAVRISHPCHVGDTAFLKNARQSTLRQEKLRLMR